MTSSLRSHAHSLLSSHGPVPGETPDLGPLPAPWGGGDTVTSGKDKGHEGADAAWRKALGFKLRTQISPCQKLECEAI